MEFRKSLLSAAAAAALIALSGGAFAADDTKSPSTAPDPAASSHSSTPDVGQPAAQDKSPMPAASDSSSSTTSGAVQSNLSSSTLPSFIVGKAVTNAAGDKIGTVDKIDGNNVIVSVGGFLGIGSHDVSVPFSQLTLTGTGDDAKLQTALSRDEFKAMPEYQGPDSKSSSSTGSMRNPTGLGGGSIGGSSSGSSGTMSGSSSR